MMAQLMENSLKLSYDMIFENSSAWQQEESDTVQQEQAVSIEEMQEKLQQRDEEWQERLDMECERANAEGFKQGFAAGKDEGLKQVTDVQESVKAVNKEFDKAMEDLKPHMAGLVFNLTEKILDIPVEHKALRQRVLQEITTLVETLDESLHVKVKLSSCEFDLMQEAFENNKEGRVTFRVDPELNPGEYAIETKKEYIVKKFSKILADFKESISFTNIGTLQMSD